MSTSIVRVEVEGQVAAVAQDVVQCVRQDQQVPCVLPKQQVIGNCNSNNTIRISHRTRSSDDVYDVVDTGESYHHRSSSSSSSSVSTTETEVVEAVVSTVASTRTTTTKGRRDRTRTIFH
jgi:hypothetical protein